MGHVAVHLPNIPYSDASVTDALNKPHGKLTDKQWCHIRRSCFSSFGGIWNTVGCSFGCLILDIDAGRVQEQTSIAIDSGRAPWFIQHPKSNYPNIRKLNNKLLMNK